MTYCSKKKEKKDESVPEDDSEAPSFLILDNTPKNKRVRLVSLYGDINEEKAEEAVLSLMALRELGAQEVYADPDDSESMIIGVE